MLSKLWLKSLRRRDYGLLHKRVLTSIMALKIDSVCFSETFVSIYKPTRRHNAEDTPTSSPLWEPQISCVLRCIWNTAKRKSIVWNQMQAVKYLWFYTGMELLCRLSTNVVLVVPHRLFSILLYVFAVHIFHGSLWNPTSDSRINNRRLFLDSVFILRKADIATS
jgi:hypothetical protein